jgi:hypothetical protein
MAEEALFLRLGAGGSGMMKARANEHGLCPGRGAFHWRFRPLVVSCIVCGGFSFRPAFFFSRGRLTLLGRTWPAGTGTGKTSELLLLVAHIIFICYKPYLPFQM